MPAGGNSRFRGYPARMSERQQLALLLQITSQETLSVSTSGTGGNRPDSIATQSNPRSLTLQSQRSSKSRWSNKNGESPINQPAQNRKDDFLNGHDPNTRGANENATTISSDERTPAQERPRFSPETGTTAPPNETTEQKSNITQNYQHNYPNLQRTGGTASESTTPVAEDSGAPCEMRRTSPQNKVDRSGSGQSGSSPRVTLRLNQVRSARDDKKGGTGNSRQSLSSSSSQGQMEAATKTSASATGAAAALSTSSTSGNSASAIASSAGTGAAASVTSGGANSTTSDSGDVYEFKSSKEATPVRGASSSPNPEKEKEKEKESSKPSTGGQNQGAGSATTSGNVASTSSEAATTSSSITTTSGGSEAHVPASPPAKRSYEGEDSEEPEDEVRKKKRKENEGPKETTKGPGSARQNPVRNASGPASICPKPGKQGSSSGVSAKSGQGASTSSADRKSPGVTSAASSSPKPPNSSSTAGANSKTGLTGPAESDGEDDRPKSSDSSSAPKVPPLKIVIPQSTTSEQEVGARNGKNPSNRSHQLPYVVPSSNSNDSTDKDQSLSASGTTSPTEVGNSSKTEEKKDFTGVLHNEERSTHHQRVLRSSHRGSNGGNGSGTSKDSGGASSAIGSYSNASPLAATSSTDRSNNSSPQQTQQTQQQQSQSTQQTQSQPQQQSEQATPLQGQQQQQRHSSPSPETTNADSGKSTTQESTTSGNSNASSGTNSGANTSKTNAGEKSEKNTESSGKAQKDGNENEPSTSSTSTFTTNTTTTPAPVELHPRKRKMKPRQEAAATASTSESSEAANAGPEVHPHDQPITNNYEEYLNIRKQIGNRRKGLFPVQPKPPHGFKDYLMNRGTYALAGNTKKEPTINPPASMPPAMLELYTAQEKKRYKMRMDHIVEKEKLVLAVEQEILRTHGRAARALANQSLPFSACTILKDEEVYNVITPEQEEKDRNARSRYNGRLFISWLQDVDDKWEKIKESMLLRHHAEAEALHAIQKMDWVDGMKELGLIEFRANPVPDELHVPIVHVSDDFDLLPGN